MTWWLDSYADRVRLEALERLDLVDANAISVLCFTGLAEALGALIGPGGGCISRPIMSYALDGAVWNMTVGAFQYYYAWEARRADGSSVEDPDPATTTTNVYGDGRQKAYRGVVVTHDPNDIGQDSVIDVSSEVAAALAFYTANSNTVPTPGSGDISLWPYLWARPKLIDTDPDTRRQWDDSTSTEVSVSLNTRKRQRSEFRLQASDPNDSIPLGADGAPSEPPWVAVGRVLSYQTDVSGSVLPGLPIVAPISCWDDEELFKFTREPGTAAYEGLPANVGASLPETGQEWQFGAPPVDGNTSGFSPFLARIPSYGGATDGAGLQFGGAGTTLLNRNAAPAGIGSLKGHLHVLRNRIKEHVLGIDESDPLQNFKDKYAWWHVPKYGLERLVEIADDLIPRMSAVEARVINPGAALGTAQAVAAGVYPYNEGSAQYDNTGELRVNVGNPAIQANNVVRLTFSTSAAVKISAVHVTLLKNTDNDGTGASTGNFDSTRDVCQVVIKELGGSPGSQYVDLMFEGIAYHSSQLDRTATLAGFHLVAYDDPTF